jgi:hypothetical protein
MTITCEPEVRRWYPRLIPTSFSPLVFHPPEEAQENRISTKTALDTCLVVSFIVTSAVCWKTERVVDLVQ